MTSTSLSNNIFRIERKRALGLGVLQPFFDVALMLLVLQRFPEIRPLSVTLLVVACRAPMLLAYPLSIVVQRNHWSLKKVFVFFHSLSCISLSLIFFVPGTGVLILLTLLAATPLHILHPLQSHLYQNFPSERRGRGVSKILLLQVLAALMTGLVFSLSEKYLNDFYLLNRFSLAESLQVLLVVFASAWGLVFALKLPDENIDKLKSQSLLSAFRLLQARPLIFWFLLSWFFLGVANLWILPFRPNLLVEEQFGFIYPDNTVFIILVLIPEFFRLIGMQFLMSRVDRIPVIRIRLFSNLLFVAYIACFFLGTSIHLHVMGMIFFGLAIGTGNVLWKAWVNKLATHDEAPLLMGLHSFLTGLRMSFSPFLGYWVLSHWGPSRAGILSLMLMGISLILLIPVFRLFNRET